MGQKTRGHLMGPFDQVIAIDWSGSKTPVRGPLSIAVCRDGKITERHTPTHRSDVAGFLSQHAAKTTIRTLVGIDANFGLAAQRLKSYTSPPYAASTLWALVDKTCATDPDFYAGSFWTAPHYAHDFWVTGPKPQRLDLPKRITEQACIKAGFGTPESPFKLLGPKQVGKGGLAAMRLANSLKSALGDKVAFWPFDTSHALRTARLVVTEIFPRAFLRMAGCGTAKLRSYTDLENALGFFGFAVPSGIQKTFSDHDADAVVAAAGLWYTQKIQPDILFDPDTLPVTVQDKIPLEGWIYGVPFTRAA